MEGIQHDDITRTDQVVVAIMSVTMVLSFLGLLSASGPGGWRFYLAGGVCAATSHAIATPIDVVKVTEYSIMC